MLRFLMAIFFCLHGQPISASPQEASPAVKISVQELDSSLILGNDRNSRLLRIGVRVSVTNNSTQPIGFEQRQLQLLLQDHTIPTVRPEGAGSSAARILQPMQTTEQMISYGPLPYSGEESPLILRWTTSANTTSRNKTPEGTDKDSDTEKGNAQIDPKPVDLDLNQELRRLNQVEQRSIGPGNELRIISVHRNLDVLAAWALRDKLRDVFAAGTHRILFVPASGKKLIVTEEFGAWLGSMNKMTTRDDAVAVNVPMPKVDFTFRQIALAEFADSPGRSSRIGRRSVRQYLTVDDAVCAALTPLYRFVPIEQAIADLESANAGVRRAALAGAVDRLSADQARAILIQAHSGTEGLQLEVAPYLHLIPGSASVEALRDLCLCDNPTVSAVALRSLAKSRDDSAAAAMAEVWKAGETTPQLQSNAVEAIVEVSDDRWLPLVSTYVSVFLRQAALPNSATIPADSITGALQFLQKRDDSTIVSEVRRELLKINNASIQDLFLEFLTESHSPENEPVIRECISQRVNDGEISHVVANAAAYYRDSAWTDGLLESVPSSEDDGRRAQTPQFFFAALGCASNEQLNQLIATIDQYNANHRSELLQHLARINFPHWQQIAAEQLKTPDERSPQIIQMLAQDASEESLTILRERIESYAAGLENTPDASVSGQRFCTALMSHLAMFVHPECRRVINRLARHNNSFLSDQAARMKEDQFRRSPAFRPMFEEDQLRKSGSVQQADAKLAECLEEDPLLPELYVRKASVEMHAERFVESMINLRSADRLSPEDIEVQSMIALVMIRLNDIENGLIFTEKVVAMAPKDWTSLYNGACTFARATESLSPTEDAKKTYAARAIELLRQTAALKFNDSNHMQNDPDLTSLHNHAEWQDVVNLVKANNANKATLPEAP